LFSLTEKIVLASASPRRQLYFKDLGLPFTVIVPDIPEKRREAEPVDSYIQRLAREKAAYVAKERDRWILAADTVVCLDEVTFEKPESSKEALSMLMTLSGKEHQVRTAVCLCHLQRNVCDVVSVVTRVLFWNFSRMEAAAYVQTGEPMDKAGSYGIQGKGAFLVREVHGSYSNVVGLPLVECLEMLSRNELLSSSSK